MSFSFENKNVLDVIFNNLGFFIERNKVLDGFYDIKIFGRYNSQEITITVNYHDYLIICEYLNLVP